MTDTLSDRDPRLSEVQDAEAAFVLAARRLLSLSTVARCGRLLANELLDRATLLLSMDDTVAAGKHANAAELLIDFCEDLTTDHGL